LDRVRFSTMAGATLRLVLPGLFPAMAREVVARFGAAPADACRVLPAPAVFALVAVFVAGLFGIPRGMRCSPWSEFATDVESDVAVIAGWSWGKKQAGRSVGLRTGDDDDKSAPVEFASAAFGLFEETPRLGSKLIVRQSSKRLAHPYSPLK
jgi:hypothetical protein